MYEQWVPQRPIASRDPLEGPAEYEERVSPHSHLAHLGGGRPVLVSVTGRLGIAPYAGHREQGTQHTQHA